ncbi:MAG: nitrophenyl compound nitroreductase subunit ArsF family protein [Candidatus Zixiibacteriota bacterium]
MNAKRVIRLVLIAFVALSAIWLVGRELPERPAPDAPATAAADGDRITVYYFHRTARCVTCLTIERLAQSEVENAFRDQIASGEIVFRSVNIEDPGNDHFTTDYNLVSQAVVLVEIRVGAPGRWKNLDAIWDLVHEEGEFRQYIRSEVGLFAGQGSS